MQQRDYGYPEEFLPWRAPAEKRGHIMMWEGELLRLTKKEQTNYPMVRWSMSRESSSSESGDANG